MNYDKLIEDMREIAGKNSISLYKRGRCADAATAIETIRDDLVRVTAERDAAVEELENYMVQDTIDGNEPCGICAKASATPCECCDPKWRGIKGG